MKKKRIGGVCMRKLVITMLAIPLITTFMCCQNPASGETESSKVKTSLTAKDNGIDLGIRIPANVMRIQVLRKVNDGSYTFQGWYATNGNGNTFSAGEYVYKDYYTEVGKKYSYIIRTVDTNWIYSTNIEAGSITATGGYGELKIVNSLSGNYEKETGVLTLGEAPQIEPSSIPDGGYLHLLFDLRDASNNSSGEFSTLSVSSTFNLASNVSLQNKTWEFQGMGVSYLISTEYGWQNCWSETYMYPVSGIPNQITVPSPN